MPINQLDFEYIRRLVRDRTALVLADDKRYLVESRLAPVLKEVGIRSLQELVIQLRADPFSALHQYVIEALVTTETLFFRDSLPFEALKHAILPALIHQRQPHRSLNIWCAACASGQEPYSIAILIREHFPELSAWNLRLLASDISGQMLERSRTGHYTQHEVGRGMSKTLLKTYFKPQGKGWQIDKQIRQMVDFQQFNLADTWPPLPMMDLILMRNVLIYFDLATKQAILAKVRQHLQPDGYLFLGGGETTINLDAAFEPVSFKKGVCYRLRGEQPAN
ncbi:MAG: protein-glutamate O-methyltransferase CheR [Cyanobacteria bacterium P01_F01_bin.4]